MGYFLSENGNKPAYGKVSYVADTAADIANLPKTDKPGSTCFVIATSDVYMLNTKQKWVLI